MFANTMARSFLAIGLVWATAVPQAAAVPPLPGSNTWTHLPETRSLSIVPPSLQNVEVIVNPSLYASGQIATGLNQYLADLTSQGYAPRLTTTTFATSASLRSHLANRYTTSGLAGAVFIGDLPVEHFERDGQFDDSEWYEQFACDLYYTDLNGAWSDTTGNSVYDAHTGNVAPEIWLGRLSASNLTDLHSGQTEGSLLNTYFQKNHAYRQGQIGLPEKGLAYIDDDWAPWANEWGKALGNSVGGNKDIVSDGVVTCAADYKSRLDPSSSTGYETVLLAAHSSSDYHAFKIGGQFSGGYVDSSEIADWNPQALFYNLFACSNADYESADYMGGEYIFGTDLGLLAVGSTKTGSMLDFDPYYNSLGAGSTFGDAMQAWWQYQAADGFSDSDRDWFYGMTILGDPTLRMQAYMVPEPQAIVLLGLGVLGLLLGRRRGFGLCRSASIQRRRKA